MSPEASPGTPRNMEITHVRDTGSVLSRQAKLMINVLDFLAGCPALVSLLLILAGLVPTLDYISFIRFTGRLAAMSPATLLGLISVGVGLGFFPVAIVPFLRNPFCLSAAYLRRRAVREVARRPEAMVDPGSTDAMFVEIVPRKNWGKVMVESASDVGFLRVDENRREILFEGDKDRYRIPVEAIVSCEREAGIAPAMLAFVRMHAAVLRVRQSGDTWMEIPLVPRGGIGLLGGNRQREALTDYLLRQIWSLHAP
jgi:hypothetical protein